VRISVADRGRGGERAKRDCVAALVVLLLLVGCDAAADAPAAHATWAGKCTRTSHCYALTYWCPSPVKKIHDIWTYVDTTNMNAPEPEGGDFVDDEMWVAPHCVGGGEWIEDGQQAGWPRTSHTLLYPFYAKKTSAGYEEFVSGGSIGSSQDNLYKIAQAEGSETAWCAYWGTTFERCYEGYHAGPAEALEQGVEAATSAEPSNKGVGEGYALGGNDNLWDGSVKAELEIQSGTCASGHSPGSGSLSFGAGKGC
jgi:hypothetical protein